MDKPRILAIGAGTAIVVGYGVAIWILWPIIGHPIQALWNANIVDVPLVHDGQAVGVALIDTVRRAVLAAFAGVATFALVSGGRRARWDVLSAVVIAGLLAFGVAQTAANSIGNLIGGINTLLGDAVGLSDLVWANLIAIGLVFGAVGAVALARFAVTTAAGKADAHTDEVQPG